MKGVKIIDNNVVGLITNLPSNWQTGGGNNYYLPVEEVNYNYNSEIQTRTGPTYEILADKVIATYTVTDKPLEEIKQKQVDKIRKKVKIELEKTDWKSLRHMDQVNLNVTPSLVASDYQTLLTERQALRDESNTKEVQINACTTNEDVLLIN